MFRADFCRFPSRRRACAVQLAAPRQARRCDFARNDGELAKNAPKTQETVGFIGHNANSSGACLHSFRHFGGDPPRFYKPGGLFRHASWRSSSPHPHVRPTLWLLDAAASANFKSILLFCVSFGWRFSFFLCIGGGGGMFSNLRRKREGVISKNSKNKICAVALRQHNRDPTGRHRLRGEWSADGLRVGGGGHGFAVRKNLLGAVCMLEVDISESEGL